MNDHQLPLNHALSDGEDFELLFAVAPEDDRRLLDEQPVTDIQLCHIGECVAEGLWLDRDGRRQPLEPRGYEHGFG